MEFKNLKIAENEKHKICKSSDYNFIFNKENGFFARWGKTEEEDPIYAPSPEIADIEIVSGGNCLGKCEFCYKCNNISSSKKTMSFNQFKNIFHKIPKTLTQVALGITNINSNPDFFKIMEYCVDNEVIPNYTTHGLDITEEVAKRTSELCGAVAVSIVDKEKSYDTIKKFTDNGMAQVNCHYLLSEETYHEAFKIIDDISSDPRLRKFNAIVFLQYKDKNPYSGYHSLLDTKKYIKLIEYCEEKKISYGFDSCSANIFVKSIQNRDDKEKLEQCVDSCESMRMSIYVNCLGEVYPCSFCEGTKGWENGINLIDLDSKDFFKEVWNSDRIIEWRRNLINTMKNGCCNCPIYDLGCV